MNNKNRASLIAILIALILGATLALAGSAGSASVAGIPLFALAIAVAYVIQAIVYIPSQIAHTERFFDLTGSLTFILISVGLLVLAPAPDARVWVLAAMVIMWAVRLGTFLFIRISRSGTDDRFDELKTSPIRFLRVWILQGLWVSFTAAAAWTAMSTEQRAPMGWVEIIGIVLWVVGMAFEVVADAQKSAFKANPANEGEYIKTGLWSLSRHPNYFGEIVLWIGVFMVAAPILVGWQFIALLSPIFVIFLLTRVSGIPLLEAKADKKWGPRNDYTEWRARTPTLVPRLTALR